ncbi:MAG TPA: 4-hydroxyphenylacetate 3-monooxygenase, oxygenase component [Nitrososphaerales archaeon]|nr:4-hydroxyphenylacetate 3-monooxygenase, oxygenase component [Nitrososphaerales archaeon]
MGARTGREYLEALDRTTRELWYGDEKITRDVSKHPAFRSIAHTIAELYDMQHRPDMVDVMTYVSPSSGERVGMSFLQPKTKEDLLRRMGMMKAWADYSGGTLGRTPDYLNGALMAMAAASSFFGKGTVDFAQNVRDYYEYVRENDLLLTHTLVNPQVNRGVGPANQSDPFIAVRIVEKTQDGVLVRGARMLATMPMADELLVSPSTVLRTGQDDLPYAMSFALPVGTKGLRMICRETVSEDSHYDHPLASRFDEQDAVVVFDDVLVPWKRVFLLEDPERANRFNEATNAVVYMTQQATVREVAKGEFLLGLVTLLAETIGVDQFPQVQEKIAEAMMTVETMKALLNSSTANGRLNEWGLFAPDFAPLNTARNLWPRVAPSLVTVVKQIGASGLIAMPPEKTMGSPIRPDVDKYYQSKLADADARIRLFKLAWDVTGSSFGGRQELYERFFFGDPVRMASAYYNWYDKEPYRQRVRQFLSRGDGPRSGSE